MNKPTTDKAIAFLAKNPTFIGTVEGYDYYEHPTKGDESPLITISPLGCIGRSEFWELPSVDDVRTGAY